jgi:zinc protease
MNARKSLAVALAMVMTQAVAGLAVADDKLPAGDKIMDNFVKSTGGKAAHNRVKNSVAKGRFEMPAAGMSMVFERYSAPPNKLYMKITSPQMGAMEQGTIDGVAWSTNPMMGAQIMEGDQADQMFREAVFNADLNWRKIYSEAKTIELTEFDGMPCYKVELVAKSGSNSFAFFEKDTWLRRGSESTVDNPMGKMTITAKAKDYKEVDGVMIPHKIEQTISGGPMTQQVVITFDSVEHNADIPADRFDLPAEIKEKQKSKKDAAATPSVAPTGDEKK